MVKVMSTATTSRLARVKQEFQQRGFGGVTSWGARWLYWNVALYRLPKPMRAPIEKNIRAPITPSLLAWTQAHPEIPLHILHPAQDITIALPNTLEPALQPGFIKRAHYHVNAKCMAVLANSRIVGADGLVVLPDGSFAAEVANGAENLRQDSAYLAYSNRQALYKKGSYFSFLMRWSATGNYYHWVHDILLKAFAVMEQLPAHTTFLVPPNLRLYQVESLRVVGVESERMASYDGQGVLELQEHYFSPPTTWSGYDLPAANAWLRRKVFAAYGLEPARQGKRIYISRQKASMRYVKNEIQVIECLAPYGFEAYILEELSFREQVTLFSQAEVIVGAHGAGMTNILFAPPGGAVIELSAPAHFKLGAWSYWVVSETQHKPYWYVECEGVPNPSAPPNCDDLIVPLTKLQATLERVLGHPVEQNRN